MKRYNFARDVAPSAPPSRTGTPSGSMAGERPIDNSLTRLDLLSETRRAGNATPPVARPVDASVAELRQTVRQVCETVARLPSAADLDRVQFDVSQLQQTFQRDLDDLGGFVRGPNAELVTLRNDLGRFRQATVDNYHTLVDKFNALVEEQSRLAEAVTKIVSLLEAPPVRHSEARCAGCRHQ